MEPWKTLARELALDLGRFLKVENHTVGLPDGRVIENWPWVIVPDYVNVLPVQADGTFLCFRQVKYAVEGVSLAPVGGMLEPGEAPLEAAQRELREEMGCAAAEFIFLGQYAQDANRGAGKGYLYLALGCEPVGSPGSDDLEEQEIIALTKDALRSAFLAGEFKVMGWATTIGLALAYLDEH